MATPEKQWAKSPDFSVFGRGTLDPNSQETSEFWYVPGFPSSHEAADRYAADQRALIVGKALAVRWVVVVGGALEVRGPLAVRGP